ncbi:GIY-YIG nuclease family protein [Vibrio harveyi]|uniref:GIY-YIG nuclease family protein n=1 Tax=Vibrio harveyi TaxID=669 RepID=UPI000695073F|nr:GIY-YIG nuclease family protein [Vibrio harveyi]ELR8729983.1 GIY-YIG nuclease family protein [Vibrio vulnificus]
MYNNDPYYGLPILTCAWLYIAIDVRDLSICKIGITTRENPIDRLRECRTSNPFYSFFNCYDMARLNISMRELLDLERYLLRKLGVRLNHIGTGNASEWVRISPCFAEKEIDYIICNNFDFHENSMIDEDGNPDEKYLGEFKYKVRPDPFGLFINSFVRYEDCQDYYDFLMDYHEYPEEPPKRRW